MKILHKAMRYFGMAQSKNGPESQNFGGEPSSSDDRVQGAKVAAIAAALHQHDLENNDVRSKVAAISAALHHHQTQNSQNYGMLGIATLVAAIHHSNKIKK